MIVARNTVKVRSATLGCSSSAICANQNNWTQGYGYQTYYITTQHEDNDIRFATGFFMDANLVTPVPQGYFSQTITSAQESAHPFNDPNGSSYHSIFWNEHVVGPVIQATIGQRVGLLYTTSTSSVTCNVTLGSYYHFPVNNAWYASSTNIFNDPFGCQVASDGRYIKASTGKRRWWYLGTYLFSQTSWSPGTPNLLTINYHATSAVTACCNGTSTTIRQHCNLNANNQPVMDFTLPIEDVNFGQPAPTGWYRVNGSTSKYWNGAIGLWTNTINNISCPITDTPDFG